MFTLEGKLEEELLQVVEANLPREVGGLIVDGRDIEVLHNYAQGDSTFEFRLTDIHKVLSRHDLWTVPTPELVERIVLWHSHPNGGVGPSREDMRHKTPLKYHLVVAYVKGVLVPTWY